MWTETLNSSNTTPPKKNNPQCSTPSQLSCVPFFHPKNIPTPTKGTNKPHLHKVPPRWLEVAFFRQNHPDRLWLPKCIRHQNSSKLHCTTSQSPPLETGWEFGWLCFFSFCYRKSSLKSSSWWFQVSTHLKMLVKLGIFPKGGEDTTYLKPPASLYLLVTENIENHEQNALKKGIMFQSHQPHTDVPLKDEWGRNGRKDEQETPLGWEFEQWVMRMIQVWGDQSILLPASLAEAQKHDTSEMCGVEMPPSKKKDRRHCVIAKRVKDWYPLWLAGRTGGKKGGDLWKVNKPQM